ncbi:hypothetical protein OMW55_01615 [Sphingomonas sp. BN140010]|uniref:RadC-like JAB domain-containing protein n=1 Tax=Sphingomonas arvum TaxID=2992113 RepID=A0ABT3JBR4_9SPHN|nr:JAB domain-containing protein [Sphingomonas sp. BN140010]MCW3796508.1 hypothetical protein [Sphingomonas sp. BN140010]
MEAEDHHVRRSDRSTARSPAEVLNYRAVLNSRKKVADFVRNFPVTGSYLRVLFVDGDCGLIDSALLASSDHGVLAIDGRKVLEDAYLIGASAFILVRGLKSPTARLPMREIDMAKSLRALSESVNVFLLDYIVIDGSGEKGLFAVRDADRFQND